MKQHLKDQDASSVTIYQRFRILYENYGEDTFRICLDQSLTFDESDKSLTSTNVSVKSCI